MSLIGPRPDPPDWLEKYPEDVKVFLNVKPGITGYSQGVCEIADDVAAHMLGIPCDHRYTDEEILQVIHIIKEVM